MLDPEKERSGNSMKIFKEKKPKEPKNESNERNGGGGMEKTRILKV